MKKASRPRPSPSRAITRSPAPAASRGWPWRWAVALLGVAGLAAVGYALWRPAAAAPEGMAWIPAGEFTMGSKDSQNFPDAQPVHPVHVDGFWMDRTEVTNEQFARFVDETGYVTLAERAPKAEDIPPHMRANLDPAKLVPGSPVFTPPAGKTVAQCKHCGEWWTYVPGACWRHPEGPDSDLKDRETHPVVHVAWEDAQAFCRWRSAKEGATYRLPTEAEWERAARGGSDGQTFFWGNELNPEGRWMANIWQGDFPGTNTAEDGFPRTAPVGSFPSNGYGLYDMAGNVWEWCADWYQPGYAEVAGVRRNPQGPAFSIDPDGNDEPKRVQRGGSFLCSAGYCVRYRAGARGQGEPRTGQSHTGFRCVRNP